MAAAIWFLIISHLETYLAAKVTATVGQGFARGEMVPTTVPAVRIYRRGEPDLNIWTRPKGTLEITMEIWAENEDPDPKEANEALAILEEAIRQALITWPQQAMSDLKIGIPDINFSGISGDGENYRPRTAAFYGIVVKWAK